MEKTLGQKPSEKDEKKDETFDSSAIINLCGERKIEKLRDGWTLHLAFYEIGNAVWKQVNIRKTITITEANIVLDPNRSNEETQETQGRRRRSHLKNSHKGEPNLLRRSINTSSHPK